MPDFTYHGFIPATYPESRHSDQTPVGDVRPGEIRDLPEAPDADWRETTDEDRARVAAGIAEAEAAAAKSAGGAAEETSEADAPAPAPRPRTRDKAATTPPGTETAGESGSKEN